jgi:hypothetical protein
MLLAFFFFFETMELPSLFTNLGGAETEWAIQSSWYKFIWTNAKQMFIKFAITRIVRQCKYFKCYSCTSHRWETCRTNTFFKRQISVKEKIILISFPHFKLKHTSLCVPDQRKGTHCKNKGISSQVKCSLKMKEHTVKTKEYLPKSSAVLKCVH